MSQETGEVTPAIHRKLAVQLFNRVWELMEKPERTAAENDEMLHAAHASRYHWGQIGEPLHFSRGEWQISRVYCILKRIEPALFHARKTLAICEENNIGDFDLAYAYEAMARAYALDGNYSESQHYLNLAKTASEQIKDEDDKKHFLSDLASVLG